MAYLIESAACVAAEELFELIRLARTLDAHIARASESDSRRHIEKRFLFVTYSIIRERGSEKIEISFFLFLCLLEHQHHKSDGELFGSLNMSLVTFLNFLITEII